MSSKIDIKDKSETSTLLKATPFKKEIRKTEPHKHNNYFEIIYLCNGSGHHFIDSRKFEVKPPVIYFVRRDQVHYWHLKSKPEGFVVIVKRAFIDKSLDNELKSLFARISGQNSLTVKDNFTIHRLLELLVKENQEDNPNSFHIVEGLLKALLVKIIDVAKPVINNREIKSDLYQSFLQLLNDARVVKHSVQYYAETLNTSPQNLNAACRRVANQSATDVLTGFIISEAKRLLHYTNNTISEIAFDLEFIDASHFVKYFKRATGHTPLAFRNANE